MEKEVLTLLKQHYPNARIVLNFSNNWELLVAVILSAQCTDVMVNRVTAVLFPKYQKAKIKSQKYKSKCKIITPELQEIINFSEVDVSELEKDIRSTGFYKNKAKNIKSAAKMILEKFDGEVPRTMDELITLPGVARKTANIVLGNAYEIVEGIAVDTHVRRLSQRLGFSKNTDPDKIEQDLMKLFDKKDWFKLTYLLIEHGRATCNAKKPKCNECFLSKLCPSAFQFPHFQKNNTRGVFAKDSGNAIKK